MTNNKPTLTDFINNLSSFRNFIEMIEPKYKFSPTFNEVIIKELDEFLRDYWSDDKPNPKKILKAPPQTGKSTITSLFISYIAIISLFTNIENDMMNGFRILIASYSSYVAKQRLKDVKKYLSDFIYQFNQVSIKNGWNYQLPSKFNINKSDEVQLNKKFHIKSVGIGGSLTGFSGDILILDDYVKDLKIALSASFKNNINDWYVSVFDSRKQEKNGILVLSTQWTSNDLLDFLEQTYKFKVMNFPAIIRDDNGVEKSICPEIKSLEFFKEVAENSPIYIWSSMYLGNPLATKGQVFNEELFKNGRFDIDQIIDLNIGVPSGRPYRVFITMDTALKNGIQNDYSVFSLFYCNSKNELYMLDCMRIKVNGNELLSLFNKFYSSWTTKLKRNQIVTLIEDKSSGIMLIQDLKKQNNMNIISVKRSTDKVTRSIEISHLISKLKISNHIYQMVVKELIEFNFEGTAPHDDICDTVFDGLAFWNDPRKFN